MYLGELEKAFDRVPTKVIEWEMRRNVIPDVSARSVLRLHEGAKTWVKVDSQLSDEFEANVFFLF